MTSPRAITRDLSSGEIRWPRRHHFLRSTSTGRPRLGWETWRRTAFCGTQLIEFHNRSADRKRSEPEER